MSNRKSAIHYCFRALILAGFSFYIVHLIQQDSLNYYIAPRMEIYVKLTAIGLYVVAAFQAIRGWQEWHSTATVSCDCEHHLPKTRLGSLITYGFFLVPLLLGFFTPDTLLGSTYAAQKGMNYSGSNYQQLVDTPNSTSIPYNETLEKPQQETGASSDELLKTVLEDRASPTSLNSDTNEQPEDLMEASTTQYSSDPLQVQSDDTTDLGASSVADTSMSTAEDDELMKMFPYDIFTKFNAEHAMELYQLDVIEIPESTFIETLTSLDLYKEKFIGKKMKMSGFMFREELMNDSQFAVSRIAMACCSADSMPFGVLAEYGRASQFEDDTWVEVVGEIEVTDFNGYELMMLKVTSIETIREPESPYVYPNYEFGL